MKLLNVSNEQRNAVIQFDFPELSVLCSILHHATKEMSPNNITYQLYKELASTRDLCQSVEAVS